MIRIAKIRLRMHLGAVLIGSLLFSASVGCRRSTFSQAEEKLDKLSDDLFAVIFMRPDRLKKTILSPTHPFGSLVPGQFSPGKIRNLPLEELYVAIQLNSDSQPLHESNLSSQFDYSVDARLSEELNAQQVIDHWRKSILEKGYEKFPEPIKRDIAGKECWVFPSGTFFPPRNLYGDLSFLDKEGEPAERGINVGHEFGHRSFFQGDTPGGAIIVFEGIDRNFLKENKLCIALNLSVVATHHTDVEYHVAKFHLRNPKTGVRSAEQTIGARSYIDQTIEFPCSLDVVSSDNKLSKGDLLDDLVSDGKLEVVIHGTRKGIFYGLGKDNVSIQSRQNEYLFQDGKRICVATSTAQLADLIETPGGLAGQLIGGVKRDSDFFLINRMKPGTVKLTNAILGTFGLEELVFPSGSKPSSMTVEVNSKTPEELVKVSIKNVADSLKREYEFAADKYESKLSREASNRFMRHNAAGNLVSFAFDGIPFQLFRQPDLQTITYRVETIVKEIREQIQFRHKNKTLDITFSLPKSLREISEHDKDILSVFDEISANVCFWLEWFDEFEDASARAVAKQIDDPNALWFRAHSLSFNCQREFDGYPLRYSWIRKGIELLLDDAQRHPDSVDSLFMAAVFIGAKIGRSDDRKPLEKIFQSDEKLLERCKKYVDLEATHNLNGQPDPLLLSKALVEYCIDKLEQSEPNTQIPTWMFYHQPPVCQSGYAIKLDENGKFEEATKEWKKAGELYAELEKKLSELPTPEVELMGGGTAQGDLPRWTQWEYWQSRCRVEVHPEIRLARKLAYEAKQLKADGSDKKAQLLRHALYQLTNIPLELLDDFFLVSADFKDIISELRAALATQKIPLADGARDYLKIIESAPKRPERSIVGGSYIFPLNYKRLDESEDNEDF